MEDNIQKQFLHIQELIDTYTETIATCRPDSDPDYICQLADESMSALLEMGMEGTGHCPCCGEAAQPTEHPEETQTSYYGNVLLEYSVEDAMVRATLYLMNELESIGDWESTSDSSAGKDTIAALENLLVKLKLKYPPR